jgi:phospholipid/cholesterol/gamma-HCH transport system substrate-binding protein
MKKSDKNHSPHYIHSMTYSFQERVVGTFVLLAMVALIGLLIATGKTKYLFEDHITLYGYLTKAQGIAPDSTVRISGIDGGYVSDIDVSEKNEIIVTMRVFKRYHKLLRTDSKAILRNSSFFGASAGIIEISAGSPDQPLLTDQAKIRIQEPYSMEELATEITSALANVHATIQELAAFVESLKPQRFAASVDNVTTITKNLKEITGQLAGGGGMLGAVLYDDQLKSDLKSSMHSLSGTVTAMETRLAELEPILADTGEFSDSIKNTLHDFPTLISQLKATVIQVNAMLSTMDNEVQQLPALVGRMRMLLDESDRTLRAAQRVWPLSTANQEGKPSELSIKPQPAHE